LLYYSGVFALIGLSAAVAAGLLAADHIVMSPDARILAQTMHRAMSLIGVCALANHIMLEILASRASAADAVVPFAAARGTFFMGLGTLASDLLIVIILTGLLRRRFARRSGRWLWRALHLTAYAAWPMAILHGLLAGRPAKPYVDWSYGACLAAVGLALTVRSIAAIRGRAVRGGAGPGRAAGAHRAALARASQPPAPERPGWPALGAPELAAPEFAARPAGLRSAWPGPDWTEPPWLDPDWARDSQSVRSQPRQSSAPWDGGRGAGGGWPPSCGLQPGRPDAAGHPASQDRR